jgi:hypothetical protein
MPHINVEFTEEEIADLTLRKIDESRRQKRELNWHDYIVILIKQKGTKHGKQTKS